MLFVAERQGRSKANMSLIGRFGLIFSADRSSSPPLLTSSIKSFFFFPRNPRRSSPYTLSSKPFLLPNLISLALALSLNSPLPSSALSSPSSSLLPTTPYSQSKFLVTGLEDGKIRPCPSTNPGCVSTNPKSSSFSFPLMIPENEMDDPIQKLERAILDTQKSPKFLVLEDTPYGRYLEVEVDGGGWWSSRDVMEFLVNGDVVSYRCVATKVTYVYPFTTAFGDSKGQQERMKKLIDWLGWYAPSFDSFD